MSSKPSPACRKGKTLSCSSGPTAGTRSVYYAPRRARKPEQVVPHNAYEEKREVPARRPGLLNSVSTTMHGVGDSGFRLRPPTPARSSSDQSVRSYFRTDRSGLVRAVRIGFHVDQTARVVDSSVRGFSPYRL